MRDYVNLLAYSTSAIVAVIAANYIMVPITNVWVQVALGLILFIVPVWFLKGEGMAMSAVKLFFGVTGLTIVLRALLGYAGVSLPASVSSVV